jgi:hypothetical protein
MVEGDGLLGITFVGPALKGIQRETKRGKGGRCTAESRRARGDASISATPQRSLGNLVEKHTDGGYFSVAGDEEIGSGILGRLAWRAVHPTDPTRAMAQDFGWDAQRAEVYRRALALTLPAEPRH